MTSMHKQIMVWGVLALGCMLYCGCGDVLGEGPKTGLPTATATSGGNSDSSGGPSQAQSSPATGAAVDQSGTDADKKEDQGKNHAPAEKPKVYTQKIPEEKLLADFGVETGKPIDTGFVFLDGKYIEAPYVVSRKGLAVYINDNAVFQVPLPKREPPSGDVDPALPDTVTRQSSMKDEMVQDYFVQKVAYISKHHSSEEQAGQMEEAIRKLPFVKEARRDPQHPDLLRITTYQGETDTIALIAPRASVKFDHESVLRRAERKRQRIEEELLAGGCMLLFSKGGSTHMDAQKLAKVVGILRSDKSRDEKFKAIQGMGLSDVQPETWRGKLVTDFTASSQLDERLKKALEQE